PVPAPSDTLRAPGKTATAPTRRGRSPGSLPPAGITPALGYRRVPPQGLLDPWPPSAPDRGQSACPTLAARAQGYPEASRARQAPYGDAQWLPNAPSVRGHAGGLAASKGSPVPSAPPLYSDGPGARAGWRRGRGSALLTPGQCADGAAGGCCAVRTDR